MISLCIMSGLTSGHGASSMVDLTSNLLPTYRHFRRDKLMTFNCDQLRKSSKSYYQHQDEKKKMTMYKMQAIAFENLLAAERAEAKQIFILDMKEAAIHAERKLRIRDASGKIIYKYIRKYFKRFIKSRKFRSHSSFILWARSFVQLIKHASTIIAAWWRSLLKRGINKCMVKDVGETSAMLSPT